MHDPATQPTPEVQTRPITPSQGRPPRLWPAVVLVALYWLLALVVGRVDKMYFVGFLYGMASAAVFVLGFLIWWVANRRIALMDRLAGLALIAAGGLVVRPFCDPSVAGFSLLMFGLPVVLTVWVLGMVVVRATGFRWYRAGAVIAVAVTWAYFGLIRVEDVTSELKSTIRWRWTPTAEDLFLASRRTAVDTDDATQPTPAAWAGTPGPGDWAEFRGTDRDGVARGVKIATDWDTAPPRLLWRQRVGPAWSSVVVVGGRLFTQEQRGEKEAVVCYDAETGRQLWAHEDEARFWETVSGAGPRATPAVADGRVYALGATGILNCLDGTTGRRHWARTVVADAGATVPQWGFSGSPLVLDGLVIVFAGGKSKKNLLAYRASDGELAWAAPAGESSYSSPQAATLAGQRQCLMLSDHGLTSVDPATGAVLWQSGAVMAGAPRTVQPRAVGPAQLLVGTYELTGLTLLDVARDGGAWKVTPRWSSKDMKPEFPDLVVHDNYAYGFDVTMFCCVDLATGKRAWKGGRYGRGQVVLLADQALLLVISENGEAILLRADPERHEELGRFQALAGKTWNHPVVANGRLYARNAEEVACYDLSPR